VANIEQCGGGVVADLIVVPPGERDVGGWRLALAIRMGEDSIAEVRPVWQRDTALESLVQSK
jgi:hypothetical protein